MTSGSPSYRSDHTVPHSSAQLHHTYREDILVTKSSEGLKETLDLHMSRRVTRSESCLLVTRKTTAAKEVLTEDRKVQAPRARS